MRLRMSMRPSASARIAISSLATAMSKPVRRGTPFSSPPRPMRMSRIARSLMSTTRRHETRSGSKPKRFLRRIDASTCAAIRLCAACTAWMSPVRWRLNSSIGIDLAVAAAGGAALDAEERAHGGLAQAGEDLLAEPREAERRADRVDRLALAERRRRDGRDDDVAARGAGPCTRVERREGDLRLVVPVRLDLGRQEARLGRDRR